MCLLYTPSGTATPAPHPPCAPGLPGGAAHGQLAAGRARNAAGLGGAQAALRLTLLQLHRRDELIARCPGGAAARGHAWVDCPEMSCVGVGYKGQETIMCFICERCAPAAPAAPAAPRRSAGGRAAYSAGGAAGRRGRQWRDAEYGVLSRVWSWVKGALFPELLDGSNWRPCPHCGAAIVKNGGACFSPPPRPPPPLPLALHSYA